MQWLLSLETEPDVITVCRLMNIFRRKGVKLGTLALASQPEGFALMVLVEANDAIMDHLFHFLRSTGGVLQVSYYRHEPGADATFVFVNAQDESGDVVGQFLRAFPGARLMFASNGKCLFEIPAEARSSAAVRGVSNDIFLPFAQVKTSRNLPGLDLRGASPN